MKTLNTIRLLLLVVTMHLVMAAQSQNLIDLKRALHAARLNNPILKTKMFDLGKAEQDGPFFHRMKRVFLFLASPSLHKSGV